MCEFFAEVAILPVLVVNPPSGRCSRMTPNGRTWQVLTWSWACSTGNPASDQVLEAAANAAWPYALLCAWTYLNDQDSAHDLMDRAIQNVTGYIVRHPDTPPGKLTARMKSQLRRRAKQLAAKQAREIPSGSIADLEHLLTTRPEIEQGIYANELFSQLSPFAQSIAHYLWLGYSWRAMERTLEIDHTTLRRAYFRELEYLLENLSRPGGSR